MSIFFERLNKVIQKLYPFKHSFCYISYMVSNHMYIHAYINSLSYRHSKHFFLKPKKCKLAFCFRTSKPYRLIEQAHPMFD